MVALSSPIKNSSVPSRKTDVHKESSAITPDAGFLVIAIIVIGLVAFVISWEFGLFKKIKKYFKNFKKKKSENDESLADIEEE